MYANDDQHHAPSRMRTSNSRLTGIRAGGSSVPWGGASGRVATLVGVQREESLSDDVVVQDLGTSERGAHQPEDEGGLGDKVEGWDSRQ